VTLGKNLGVRGLDVFGAVAWDNIHRWFSVWKRGWESVATLYMHGLELEWRHSGTDCYSKTDC